MNNTTKIPCMSCMHNNICIHKELMQAAQRQINNAFLKDSVGDNKIKYELVNKLSTAGITMQLSCKHATVPILIGGGGDGGTGSNGKDMW